MRGIGMVTIALVGALATSNGCLAQERCTTVADCAQKAMEAAYQAKLAFQIALPKGAVMAFNLPKCPDGWAPFAPLSGRVIVGVGAGAGLTERKLGDRGGEEEHRLTVDEMPSHSHQYQTAQNWDGDRSGRQNAGYERITPSTSPAGGDKPHNTMPPFQALLYCERQ